MSSPRRTLAAAANAPATEEVDPHRDQMSQDSRPAAEEIQEKNKTKDIIDDLTETTMVTMKTLQATMKTTTKKPKKGEEDDI